MPGHWLDQGPLTSADQRYATTVRVRVRINYRVSGFPTKPLHVINAVNEI
jgi:hypothetical protein